MAAAEMADVPASPPAAKLHLIDEKKAFSSGFEQFVRDTALVRAGFDYNVVAVFGSQSTGKSTLLNGLFGTGFATMDDAARQQTTKGIWIGKATGASLVVMDVEGTDGHERGEDQEFERKSALFSIATSQVILINMWEHQVGLYHGANMALLKTVFEVDLELFHNDERTQDPGNTGDKSLLMFVIRDFVGGTPLESLQATVMRDLDAIWASIAKPEALQGSSIHDFFDFQFFGLPHKVLLPEKFNQQLRILQKRFIDPNDPDYVFKPEYHRRIPADGFPHYAQSIWAQIESNKDLDLPTQQQLLAQFRCDEIAVESTHLFDELFSSIETKMAPGLVLSNLAPLMSAARQQALSLFDTEASRYNGEIYMRKRADTVAQYDSRLKTLFVAQLSALHQSQVKAFADAITAQAANANLDEFGRLSQQEYERALAEFDQEASRCCLSDTNWTSLDERALLVTDLDAVMNRVRIDEVKKLREQLLSRANHEWRRSIPQLIAQADADMWDKCFDRLDSSKEAALVEARQHLHSLGVDNVDSELRGIQENFDTSFRKLVTDHMSPAVISLNLRERFEDKFRYDENGIPRLWRSGDNIEAHFRTAYAYVLRMISLYAEMKRTNSMEAYTILDDVQQAEITQRFKRAADSLFLDAKRSTISTTTSIPLYIYVLIVILGWNEFWAVLRNPFGFVALVMLVAGAYAVIQLNLAGPIERVAGAVLAQCKDMAREQLRAFVESGSSQSGEEKRLNDEKSRLDNDELQDDLSRSE